MIIISVCKGKKGKIKSMFLMNNFVTCIVFFKK